MRGVFRQAISRKPVLAVVFVVTVLVTVLAAVAQAPASASPPTSSQPAPQPVELKLNTPIPRKLAGGHADTFTVRCTAGDFVRIIVDQQGIDVAVSILDPAGKSLVDADSPNSTLGPESASAICPATAAYTVRVSSSDAAVPPGEYVIHLDALRPPEPNDSLRIEAEQSAFAAAAHVQGTKEEMLRASQLLSKAVDDWSKIGDRYESGLWGTTLGVLWSNLGSQQQSVAAFKKVLDDERSAGDRAGEAAALEGIGDALATLGQLPASLDDYLQALPIFRSLGDRANEAATLKDIGADYRDMHQTQKALDFFAQALAIENEQKNYAEAADSLLGIGAIHAEQGDPKTALGFYTQALPLERAAKDRDGEANALNRMGMVSADMGEVSKALELYQQVLPIARETHNRGQEAATLSNMGRIYGLQGQQQKALDYTLQALAIKRTLPDRSTEGITLNNVGMIYHDLGDNQKALDFYQQALPVLHQAHLLDTEGIALGNIGQIYSDLGEKEKALDFYNQAVSLLTEVGDKRAAAIDLIEIGVVYFDLDQKQKALEMYQQALPMVRAAADRVDEATCLMRIGVVYNHTNQPNLALQYFNQALPITVAIGRRVGEAAALNNLGNTYEDLGDKQKALDYWDRAVLIEREIGEHFGESNTLMNIGRVSDQLGDPATSLRDLLAAFSLARGLKDPNLEGMVDTQLLTYFRHHNQPYAAIYFGMDAVRCFQQIRGNISGLAKELQTGFVQSKSPTYRALAELLVQDDRLAEAEHVLDLLKDVELEETVRGGPATKTDPLPLGDADRAAEASVTAEVASNASNTDDGFEFDRLSSLPTPSDADKARLKELATKIAAKNAELQTFFDKTLYEELGGNAKSNARATVADTETSSLSNQLAELGPGTLALYTLAGDQHSYIIVTTATTRTRYDLHTNAADLGKLVLALRQELRSPASDPSKDLATLSHILLDPIAPDLAAAARRSPDGIPTLLWSLDGVLRYVPMNALFDPTQPQGRQYLAERARNVVITPESRNHLLDQPGNGTLRAAAFGVSQSYLGLHALSGVPAELDAVVRDPAVPASHGPLNGQLLRDDAFTLATLESSLKQHFSVVHIASHFVFQAGKSGESYLLLSGEDTGGKGYELTMSKLQTDPQLSFRGTRLLTLSACSTAEADTGGNGREIDSLGMVMQKRDAAAVLATLWDVNDASTAQLMADFYSRWAATPGIEKVEALRQAQLAMLHNTASIRATTGRGNTVEAAAPTATYAHPYYWAPFVLIGNFR
jgi:CHAT domain-containing protein